MCSQITDFALAGKCGGLGASGFAACSSAACRVENTPPPAMRPPTVNAPSPPPALRRKSRRVVLKLLIDGSPSGSVAIDEFVGIRERVREVDESDVARGGTLLRRGAQTHGLRLRHLRRVRRRAAADDPFLFVEKGCDQRALVAIRQSR